ncbi:hypothetical protein [Microbacterium sp. 3J1]|uniref:hypothetical protein n=1 Tax=Microbacterium sp. 3J1 TaxID=861269 RepID=UPI000A611C4E|nr:hypothetical protein [Microbacterium sp. 3J1]
MTSRQLRLLRAAAASTVATLLAAASHTVAGGAAPHPLLVLAVASLLVPVAAVLIGVRASRRRVALTVLVSQAAFHVVFQMLGSPTGIRAVDTHHHHVDLAAFGPVTQSAAPGALMVAAHIAAAIVTTMLLWHGESMVRAIADWVRARLLRVSATHLPDHARPASLISSLFLPLSAGLASSISRRGPPSLV